MGKGKEARFVRGLRNAFLNMLAVTLWPYTIRDS